jgi:oligopeptide/dipeptide ABC transporter ATP-binding protein
MAGSDPVPGLGTLAVERLSVGFGPGDARVVRDVSLRIAAGETLALVGESGCGKSVTSLAVMGLLPAAARVSGRILLGAADGAADLLALEPAARRRLCGRRIGMIFQEPMTSLNPMHPVGRQIAEPLVTHGLATRREAAARAVEMLREMGIPDPARRAAALPHELSGGMRQRVMIAMALACGPDLLIADEPTTALDVTVQAQIMDLLRRLRDARGMAMLFISHDLAVVSEIADRIAIMYAGEVVETGPVAQVLAAPRHPYTAALLASRPDARHRGGRLPAIPGAVPEPARHPSGCAFHPRCARALPGLCDARAPVLERHDAGMVRCLRVGAEAA